LVGGVPDHQVDAVERALRDHRDRHVLAAERDRLALAARAGDRSQAEQRDVPLLEDAQDLAADGAGRSNHGDMHGFHGPQGTGTEHRACAVQQTGPPDDTRNVKTLAVALVLVSLAACGGGSAPNGGQTRFLLLAHVPLAGSLSTAPDATLLDLGHRACAEMDTNTPSDQIVADIGGNPEPGSEA